jgi:hypothetical protein
VQSIATVHTLKNLSMARESTEMARGQATTPSETKPVPPRPLSISLAAIIKDTPIHVARAPRMAATSSSFSTKLLGSIFSPIQTCGGRSKK